MVTELSPAVFLVLALVTPGPPGVGVSTLFSDQILTADPPLSAPACTGVPI